MRYYQRTYVSHTEDQMRDGCLRWFDLVKNRVPNTQV